MPSFTVNRQQLPTCWNLEVVRSFDLRINCTIHLLVSHDPPPWVMPAHECSFCHNPTPKQCLACKKAWYCSKECQRYDWVRHIFDCNPSRPITTADYLALAVDQNLLPEHPQTCKDYGFTRTTRREMLLGLYIGLMERHYLSVKPQTLHNWRLNGTLVENIKRKFEEGFQGGNRGGYYLWFLQNQHVLSGERAEENEHEVALEAADEMSRRAWRFIGRSPTASLDDIRQYIKSATREENDCYFLYSMVLSRSHPGPYNDQWVDFGFCACSCQETENELAQSYIALINRCTFEQFLNAYTSCSLVSLFRDNNIDIAAPPVTNLLNICPLIIDVLSGMQGGIRGHKSVWNLKRYIELKASHGLDDTTINHTPAVGVDYGFYNCKTSEEHKLLFDLYKGFFALGRGADPLQLHQACIEGRLLSYFAQDLKFKIKPRKTYERLLWNPYPLRQL